MQNNLDKQVGQATKWSSITEIVATLIASITNAILARLLIPEAFGVVATLLFYANLQKMVVCFDS